ncbi:MAG: glycosyltransferase family 4 protein [Xenococcaceae cyanobacterium]
MLAKKIVAFYAVGTGFSGQRFATEILLRGLKQKEWQIKEVGTPSFDRVGEQNKFITLSVFFGKLLITCAKGLVIALSNQIIYVNLGQSKLALIREGFPLLIRSFLPFKKPGIISLHGSVFLNWSKNNLETKLLCQITKAANYITILGPNHQKKLIELGIPKEKIAIVDNTCLLEPLTETEVLQKQQIVEPIKILHLSSLVETKGYLEFVESIRKLSSTSNLKIDAVLCGKITDRKQDNLRFPDPNDAKQWIEKQIESINKSARVRLYWIDGAVGEEKAKLFREAHIFVLPTRYKVEAQPIVILEALASGCAVITTKVGEITSTLSDSFALLLDDYSSVAIAEAIEELINNCDRRREFAINGLSLFDRRFSFTKHIERWEELLKNLCD